MLEQRACGAGDELHHGFIGFDLRQHVTDRDSIAFLLFPLD
jgi:hypothetical protein